MEAVPFYHENGYDALDPADGALRQMTAYPSALGALLGY
jgi:hypothetical protein